MTSYLRPGNTADRDAMRAGQARALIGNFIEACKASTEDRDIFMEYALRRAEHALSQWDKEDALQDLQTLATKRENRNEA